MHTKTPNAAANNMGFQVKLLKDFNLLQTDKLAEDIVLDLTASDSLDNIQRHLLHGYMKSHSGSIAVVSKSLVIRTTTRMMQRYVARQNVQCFSTKADALKWLRSNQQTSSTATTK